MPSAPTYIVALVNIVAGMTMGLAIGFVPFTIQYNTAINNCTSFVGEAACAGVERANCVWHSSNSSCEFSDGVNCSAFTANEKCAAVDGCYWDFGAGNCDHNTGWTPAAQGIFAGSMILGAMIASGLASFVLEKLGRKKTLLLTSCLSAVATALSTVAWKYSVLGLLDFSRLVAGLAVGFASVTGPMYVGEMAKAELAESLGVLFQLFVCFGIALSGFIGFLLSPEHLLNDDYHLEARFHLYILPSWVCAVGLAIISFIMPESNAWLKERGDERAPLTGEEESPVNNNDQFPGSPNTIEDNKQQLGSSPATPLSATTIFKNVCISIILACSLQLTGINAMINYAPKITGALGIAPLLGNLIVSLWNFITTIIAIPLAKKFHPRTAYLIGCLGAGISCLVTAITSYPGVTNKTAQLAAGGTFILIFILFFAALMGPFFYILAQSAFPAQMRGWACALTVNAQFVFNLLINFVFPVALVNLSGGTSGDPNKGLAICFFFFSAIGFASFLLLLFLTKSANAHRNADHREVARENL